MTKRKILWGRVLSVGLLTASALGAGLVPTPKPHNEPKIYDAMPMGNGTARVFVRYSTTGEPSSYGLILDESALTGLPTRDARHCCDGPEFVLRLPDDAGVPVKHVGINWNPKGHEPAGVYDKPHFDFHFYFITNDQRQAIAATGADEAKTCRPMAEECVPQGYLRAPGGVPRMGAHWIDPTSPEFNGKPFTTTFLYGSYDGQLTFVEPMITKAFLESRPNYTEKLKLPKRYEVPGYYPTSYRVSYDAVHRQYTIAMEGLVKR